MPFKKLVAIALIASVTAVACDGRAEREAEAAARCDASPGCVARRADENVAKASKASSELMRAPSGTIYFRGKACSSECETVREGYEFARSVELNNPEGCASKGEAYLAGCKTYYDEIEQERYEELQGEAGDGR